MIIRGARWFDSETMQFHEGDQIWIDNGVIKEIGKGLDKPGREVLDFQGMMILPGWIDAHVHLTLSGRADPLQDWQTDGNILTVIKGAVSYLKAHLLAGVTMVRDLGGDGDLVLELKRALAESTIDGPVVYTAGKALTMTGGHIHQISQEVDGPYEARKWARVELKKGVDLLKVIATGGILTQGVDPGSPQLSVDEMREIVQEAHKAGRKVAAHAEGSIGIENSLKAGVDTIEHGIGLDVPLIQQMKKREIILIPTLAAPRLILRNRDQLPKEMVKKAEQVVEEHRESFALAKEQGCTIAVGTDAGTPFNQHGQYAMELAELLNDGMKVEELLQAVSLHGAIALGIEDQYGNIQPEKVANLTIIEDQMNEKDWYQKVKMVMAKGKLVKTT